MILTFITYLGGLILGAFALGFLSLFYEHLSFSLKIKKLILEREIKMTKMIMGKKQIPDHDEESWEILQKMIAESPNHPEIAEIEKNDQIMGVLFEGKSYPPELM